MAILERTPVVAAESMTDENFAKHMEMRHPESMGYLTSFSMTLGSPYLMRMWRLFHHHLHQWRIDLAHEHGEA